MRRDSLRWRLPLFICVILAVAMGLFAAAAHREMQDALILAGGDRARAAATQFATLLAQSSTQRIAQLQRAADTPAVRAFAASPGAATETSARDALARAVTSSTPQTIEIWSRQGQRLAAIHGASGAAGESGGPPPATGMLPFRVSGTSVVTETAVPITGPSGGEPLGVLLVRRSIAGGQTADVIRRLVGTDAVVRIGSPGGAWTDLARPADAPPLAAAGVTDPRASRAAGMVAGAEAVAGTPWIAAVGFPLSHVIGPARTLLATLLAAAVVIILGAAIAGYVVTGKLTRPLAELSRAATAIAAGDYTRRAAVRRTDEIGRLAAAFNTMSAEVEHMHERLETRVQERTRELEAFSYSVSHDLRAPLRHIVGFAGLLERRATGQLDAESRRFVTTISEAASRMGRLIDDLLSFSRTGRTPLEMRAVPLGPIVEEARREAAADASGRSIEWMIGELPTVLGDPALLRQVFANLLSNAVKYTAPKPAPRIEVRASRADNGDAIITVRDNGVGFDPQYAAKLFGVFQRLHRADEFPGTGIGLANVRQIVHRHGGRTWAEGVPGEGAAFHLSLPSPSMETA